MSKFLFIEHHFPVMTPRWRCVQKHPSTQCMCIILAA